MSTLSGKRKSQYSGVSWDKREKRWLARFTYKGKSHFVGYFDNEIEAAEAINGRCRYLNIPVKNKNIQYSTSDTDNNKQVARPFSGRPSKYKNVYWQQESKTWQAKLDVNGKILTLGNYHSEIDAAISVNNKCELLGIDLKNPGLVGYNLAPRHGQTKKTSKYRHVNWDRSSKKWRAQMSIKGKQTYIGLYETEEAAASAINQACRELNIPLRNPNLVKTSASVVQSNDDDDYVLPRKRTIENATEDDDKDYSNKKLRLDEQASEMTSPIVGSMADRSKFDVSYWSKLYPDLFASNENGQSNSSNGQTNHSSNGSSSSNGNHVSNGTNGSSINAVHDSMNSSSINGNGSSINGEHSSMNAVHSMNGSSINGNHTSNGSSINGTHASNGSSSNGTHASNGSSSIGAHASNGFSSNGTHSNSIGTSSTTSTDDSEYKEEFQRLQTLLRNRNRILHLTRLQLREKDNLITQDQIQLDDAYKIIEEQRREIEEQKKMIEKLKKK